MQYIISALNYRPVQMQFHSKSDYLFLFFTFIIGTLLIRSSF